MNPDKVIDRDGHTWHHSVANLYRHEGTGDPLPLPRIRDRWGPLIRVSGADPLQEVRELPAPGTRLRDADGDIWETGHAGMVRLVEADGEDLTGQDDRQNPKRFDVVRDIYGPLTIAGKVTSEPEPKEGDQFRDRDGDIWRVMRNGKFRVYGPSVSVGDNAHGYESTTGWAEPADWLPSSENLVPVPEDERAPFVPPLAYAPVGAAYRDEDGDIWYRAEDGDRWTTAWAIRTDPFAGHSFAAVDRLYGPLERDESRDKAVNTPEGFPDGVRFGTFERSSAADTLTLAGLRAQALRDEDGTTEEVPATNERGEALAAAVILARAAHAGEDGRDATDIAMTAVDFAKFLLNED